MVCKKCLQLCDRLLPHINDMNGMILGEEEINYYFYLLENLEKINKFENLLTLPRMKKHFDMINFPKVTNFICGKCRKRFHDQVFRYTKSQVYTFIFNILTRDIGLLSEERKVVLKEHLEKISKFVKCKDWLGIMYYWYQIDRVPYPLRDVVKFEDYFKRKKLDIGNKVFNHRLSYENNNSTCLEYILEFYSI